MMHAAQCNAQRTSTWIGQEGRAVAGKLYPTSENCYALY